MSNKFKKATDFINSADEFLVVSHVSPDGDAIGSTAAIGYLLLHLGKKVNLVNQDPVPNRFHFLQQDLSVVTPDKLTKQYTHVIMVDCADSSRVGNADKLLASGVKILNIDHHLTNPSYGIVNIVVPEAAATAEIIYDWIEELHIPWSKRLATAVYTGILTDTGGFRYANTSPKILKIAAHLIELGIDASVIADESLEAKSMHQVKALKNALNTLEISDSGRVAWMFLTKQDMDILNRNNDDMEGIVNYARNIYGVEIGILFYEVDEGVKISLRSKALYDVGTIAKAFKGGGHARAAGCTIKDSLDKAMQKVLSHVFGLMGE